MKGIIKKVFILFLAVVTVLTITGCKKDKKKKYVYNPNINYKDDMDDDMFKDAELHEVDIPNPDAFSNAYMDVEPNFTLQLALKGAYLTASEVSSSVFVNDSFGQKQEILIDELVTGDFSGYALTSKEGYTYIKTSQQDR